MPQWQQGASYCYEVTTLLGGLESVASNQVITAAPMPASRRSSSVHRGALIGWITLHPRAAKGSLRFPNALTWGRK